MNAIYKKYNSLDQIIKWRAHQNKYTNQNTANFAANKDQRRTKRMETMCNYSLLGAII